MTKLPGLNIGRYDHSSCCINGFVYVFGGMDYNDNAETNTIEKLSM